MITVSAQHGATPKVVLELDLPDASELMDFLYEGWPDVEEQIVNAITTLEKEAASGN